MLKAVQNYDVSLLNFIIMKTCFGNERYPRLTLQYFATSQPLSEEEPLLSSHLYANGWREVLEKDGYALYRSDNSLVANKLKNCHVYENGWYELVTQKGCALYQDNGILVAENLLACYVYPNESYCLRTPKGWTLYRYNGTVVAQNMISCQVHDDGTFDLQGRL